MQRAIFRTFLVFTGFESENAGNSQSSRALTALTTPPFRSTRTTPPLPVKDTLSDTRTSTRPDYSFALVTGVPGATPLLLVYWGRDSFLEKSSSMIAVHERAAKTGAALGARSKATLWRLRNDKRNDGPGPKRWVGSRTAFKNRIPPLAHQLARVIGGQRTVALEEAADLVWFGARRGEHLCTSSGNMFG
jgi:hypothetical protein